MAKAKDKHWMEKAFAHANGQLRAKTKTKAGKDISTAALNKASKSKDTKTARQANLAKTAKRINRAK